MRPEGDSIAGRAAGFTLAEMAIVLLVVGLLLSSVLTTVSTQLDARNLRDMQTQMDQIKDALIGYAQTNGRLPCPADGTLATGATNAGLEQLKTVSPYDCSNANGFGVLPWATLGVAETDVWGNRFGYKVSSVFSDAVTTTATFGCSPTPTPTVSSFALCSQGTLTVTTRTTANKVPGTPVSYIPVVIISYGKNGYGAYTSGGTQITAPPAANVDETANATATSTTFYSREQSPQASPCSDTAAGNFCEFDDLIGYIPVNLLITRMISAGKLP